VARVSIEHGPHGGLRAGLVVSVAVALTGVLLGGWLRGGWEKARSKARSFSAATAAWLPITPAARATNGSPLQRLGPSALVHTRRIGARIHGCPAEMARVGDSCVDRFEAILVETNSAGREIIYPSCQQPKPGFRYEARSIDGMLPQAYVSRPEAEAACRNAGKRLCSLGEWFDACRGSQKLTHPYGNEFAKDKCNSGKTHLLGAFFGNHPRWWSYEKFNSPRMNLEPGFLSPTGDHVECKSDYGTHDMVGNLHEWVSDRVDYSLERKIPLVDGVRKSIRRNIGNGIFMGGFYSTSSQQGEGCGFIVLAHAPAYHDYSTGFRCCADAASDGSR